jgi:type IV pilus assembly protein PilV
MPMNSYSRQAQQGSLLIEALVTIVIVCFGILAVVGLHSLSVRAQSEAKYRADAANLALEMVGAIWADRGHVASYAVSPTGCIAPAVSACSNWVSKVAASLPRGSATVNVTPASGAVAIQLSWTVPGGTTHSYAVSTSVN